MYLLSTLLEPDETRAKLLRAGLELLADKGYKGATTREIAARAKVSEVTLFRHFGNKEALLQRAIQSLNPPIQDMFSVPSGQLEADLLALTEAYRHQIAANQHFILRLLPELSRHPELRGAHGPVGIRAMMTAGAEFIAQYQRNGQLRPDEAPFQLAIALLGPIFASAMLENALGIEAPLDLPMHVQGFLNGRMGVTARSRR